MSKRLGYGLVIFPADFFSVLLYFFLAFPSSALYSTLNKVMFGASLACAGTIFYVRYFAGPHRDILYKMMKEEERARKERTGSETLKDLDLAYYPLMVASVMTGTGKGRDLLARRGEVRESPIEKGDGQVDAELGGEAHLIDRQTSARERLGTGTSPSRVATAESELFWGVTYRDLFPLVKRKSILRRLTEAFNAISDYSPRIFAYKKLNSDILIAIYLSVGISVPVMFPWSVFFDSSRIVSQGYLPTILVCVASTLWSIALVFSEALLGLNIIGLLKPHADKFRNGERVYDLATVADFNTPLFSKIKEADMAEEEKEVNITELRELGKYIGKQIGRQIGDVEDSMRRELRGEMRLELEVAKVALLKDFKKIKEFTLFLGLQFIIFLVETFLCFSIIISLTYNSSPIDIVTIQLSTLGVIPWIMSIINIVMYNKYITDIEANMKIGISNKVKIFGVYEPDAQLFWLLVPPVGSYIYKLFF